MKKALSLLLVLVMCLSLCACTTTNTSLSKEALLEMVDTSFPSYNMCEDYFDNPVSAKEKYIGKVLSKMMYISEITDTYVYAVPLSPDIDNNGQLVKYKVHLSKEEIKSLHKKQTVRILGRISNIEIPGYVELDVAYVTETTWELFPLSVFSFQHDNTTNTDYAVLRDTLVGSQSLFHERFTCPVEKNGDQYSINGVVVEEGMEVSVKFTGKITSHTIKPSREDRYECDIEGTIESIETVDYWP